MRPFRGPFVVTFRDKQSGDRDISYSYCVIFPIVVLFNELLLVTCFFEHLTFVCLLLALSFFHLCILTNSPYSRTYELLLESNPLASPATTTVSQAPTNAHQHPTRFSAGLESQTYHTTTRCLPQQPQQPSACHPSCVLSLLQSFYLLAMQQPT